jgi:hypothetical protein
VRESAHARELEINRRQQQIEFNSQQIAALAARMDDLGTELNVLRARREPGRLELEARREQLRVRNGSCADALVAGCGRRSLCRGARTI